MADAIAVAKEEEREECTKNIFAYLRRGHSLEEAEKRFNCRGKSKTRAN